MKNILIELTPPIVRRIYRDTRRSMAGVKTPRREFLLPEIGIEEILGAKRIEGLLTMPLSLGKDRGPLALPTHEAFLLAALCQRLHPAKIFEFGTYTGLSSLIMAANSPEATRIFTLDIDPQTLASHQHGLGVGGIAPFPLGRFFRESSYSHKVTQLLGDSQQMDFSPYRNQMDLIFIDADHSYSFVKADTARALEMRSKEGIIVWDDYVWSEDHPECAGVAQVVHELSASQRARLFRLKGSRLALLLPESLRDQ